jgi:hypothetical protein
MKKPTKSFAAQYPYLTYWIEDWGEMETTSGDWGNPRIRLIDDGGTCFEDYAAKTHEEALVNAEKHLRDIESQRFDKATKAELEAKYALLTPK